MSLRNLWKPDTLERQKLKIAWPDGKKFAFTIIDDTDYSSVANTKPVYELLIKCGISATKTVWVYPSRDRDTGSCLLDKSYLKFIKYLMQEGIEIAVHNVGSGEFTRDEIKAGLEKFKELLGFYPRIQINHAADPDNIYWGYKRFVPPLSWFMWYKKSYGEDPNSKYFWGDLNKEHVQYIRNRVFNGINTQKYDSKMPYRVSSTDKYSNYWFSSSDGHTVEEFNSLLKEKNINLLERDGGFCVVYTHFSYGFVDKNGQLDKQFEESILRLSSKNGWFVPAGRLLDFLLSIHGSNNYAPYLYLAKLDGIWFVHRIVKRIRFGR